MRIAVIISFITFIVFQIIWTVFYYFIFWELEIFELQVILFFVLISELFIWYGLKQILFRKKQKIALIFWFIMLLCNLYNDITMYRLYANLSNYKDLFIPEQELIFHVLLVILGVLLMSAKCKKSNILGLTFLFYVILNRVISTDVIELNFVLAMTYPLLYSIILWYVHSEFPNSKKQTESFEVIDS